MHNVECKVQDVEFKVQNYKVQCTVQCTVHCVECGVGQAGVGVMVETQLGVTSVTRLHSTALHSTALHCTAMNSAVLHCTAMYNAVMHCSAMFSTTPYCTALHCTAQKLTRLYYIAPNIYLDTVHFQGDPSPGVNTQSGSVEIS